MVVILGGWGLLSGFRRGMAGQVCSLLGMAFGIVCARALMEDAEEVLRMLFPFLTGHVGSGFIYSTLAAGGVYVIVYVLFTTLTRTLRNVLRMFHVGILDSMAGAFFGALKYLVVLSIVFNCIVCVNPGSVLVKSSSDSDGNLLGGVMAIAPGILGSLSCSDFALLLQLHEARKISQAQPCNVNSCSIYMVSLTENSSRET